MKSLPPGRLFAVSSMLVALAASPTAFADNYTVTVQGTFTNGQVGSNTGGRIFGLPAGTPLKGIPATIVFTIDSTLGKESVSKLGATPYASQIVPNAPGITRLVIAQVTLNRQSDHAGGTYPPEVYKPIVLRSLTFTGAKVTASEIRIWTSEKSKPYTDAGRVTLTCRSPIGSPFTTDHRWNGSLRYEPVGAPQCVASILFHRPAGKGWVEAMGEMTVTSIDFAGEPPVATPPAAR